jgi:glyoxylase-like metal-dependent hydrolase (beta-lactamase superfamily II)
MKNKILLTSILLSLLTATTSVIAQDGNGARHANGTQLNAAQRSYQQARKVLDDGIQAMGGVEALRSIKDFTLKEKARFTRSIKVLNLRRLSLLEIPRKLSLSISGIRRLPPFVLLEALDRASTLRWVGEDEIGGKKQKVISVLRPDNQLLSLSFDAQTNLLTKYGYLYADPMVGDSEIAQTYSGYRTVGKVKIPSARILYNSGAITQEAEYTEVTINKSPAGSMFEGPQSFAKLAAPPATPPPPAVTKVADDVYFLQGLNGGTHNVLFVAFNDYVLVLEAPEQTIYGSNSVQALAKIKETLPGKPIKYLVLTHHHSDHAGGFREYVAAGATIVTTAGNKNFLEKVAAVDSSMLPSTSWMDKKKLTIETIEDKKRVFQDDKHVVELYDVGPNPHANEIIVAYLPKQKILFQGDLFNSAANGTIPIAQDVTVSFGEKLQQLGLEVEKIYGVHCRAATPEELRTAIEKRRTSDLK